MATTFRIVEVHTEAGPGDSHEHIDKVKLPAGSVFSRSTVIKDLRDPNGDRYYTQADGAKADVIVAGCPHCTYGDYITTEPDWSEDNNLLELPRF